MVNLIKKQIELAFSSAEVIVRDPMNDNQHFQAFVISSEFEGLTLVKQHRTVMNALRQELQERVHAVQLRTFTPDVWEQERTKYGL